MPYACAEERRQYLRIRYAERRRQQLAMDGPRYRDHRWRAEAACAGMPTDMFFPTRGDHAGHRAACAVCDTCPVSEPCLADALASDMGHGYGIRAGTTGEQRKEMRKQIKARGEHVDRYDTLDTGA